MFSIDRSDHAAARGQALSNRFTANGFFLESVAELEPTSPMTLDPKTPMTNSE
jgi:hypothetical protein